jgi:hemolysin D
MMGWASSLKIDRWFAESAATEREFLPAALEIVATPASPSLRITALAICGVFAAGLLWAGLGTVDVVTVASGKFVAGGRTKIIQPAEIGTLRAIRVDDGQSVKAGDVLIELDPTAAIAERDHAARDLAQARLDIARLTSLLDPAGPAKLDAPEGTDPADLTAARLQAAAQYREQQAKLGAIDRSLAEKKADIAGAQASLAQIQAGLPIAQERAQIRRDGVESGFGSRLTYLEALNQVTELETSRPIQEHRLEAAKQAAEEAERLREQTEAEFTSGIAHDLILARQQASAATEAFAKASERARLERLVAPVDGIVSDLAVHTVGGVVTPGEQLLTIVPTEGALDIDAIVDNRDIGFVTVGQPVEIKVETFPYTRYGLIPGKVEDISMDAVFGAASNNRPPEGVVRAADAPASVERSQSLVYAVRVAPARTHMMIDGHDVALIPGMAVTVEIKTGRRRVLDYLISPISDSLHDSLRER